MAIPENMIDPRELRILPAADDVLLVEYANLDGVVSHFPALAKANIWGIKELVPAASTIMVHFEPGLISPERLASTIRSITPETERNDNAKTVNIDVLYNGEDFDDVCAMLNLSAEELIARHTANDWQVAFVGFAPGFAYCVGKDPIFNVARRPSPRTRIPAGSVGLAGEFAAVYPGASPGGWQLIGVTDAPMWDLNREQPGLLAPGDHVKYHHVRELLHLNHGVGNGEESAGETPGVETVVQEETQSGTAPGRSSEENSTQTDVETSGETSAQTGSETSSETSNTPAGATTGEKTFAKSVQEALAKTASILPPSEQVPSPYGYLEVVSVGGQLLYQDHGRPGLLDMGVAASGAADPLSMHTANYNVGNPDKRAVLEIAGGGVELKSHMTGVLAISGAKGEVTVTQEDGLYFYPEHGHAFAVDPGDTISIGWFEQGMRAYVAIRGGIAAKRILGSLATDTLANVGPAPLTVGDKIYADNPSLAGAVADAPRTGTLIEPDTVVKLRITLGPRTDWFTDEAIATLTEQIWTVSNQSDRVGIRLEGEKSLERCVTRELPSEGAVTGAIQVPSNGQPVIFLPDHPLTGGYPVIGALIREDLDVSGQLTPGTRIQFLVDEPFTEL
ncbi:5-oxoprolinase subunit B/C family protein [Actinotignum urinale]|uniref:5-oxoprolinase/urea amidolyase family protein n=1 Tax=Actinotignum urinale TaxID=190146 RepID=A0ABU5G4Y9_9ACTO|nr:5-oxoprolinase/urea amidolyase family protein [Actinotignum urinale]MDY5132427.1 5-oxoprolinase/urea amidolyase family protein [Actinotignum urinale]